MSETYTTYGIGPDKQFDELQALRDENVRLRRALRIAVFMDDPNSVQPEFERWSVLVDEGLRQNFNEWYGQMVLLSLTPSEQAA